MPIWSITLTRSVTRRCCCRAMIRSGAINAIMAASVLNKIEYLVLMVAAFASRTNVSEAQAYRYLSQYGALALCDKHYGIMHTLSLEENIETLQAYCQRKGGKL